MIPGNDQHLGLVQFEYMLVDCTQRLGLAAGGHLNLTLTYQGRLRSTEQEPNRSGQPSMHAIMLYW